MQTTPAPPHPRTPTPTTTLDLQELFSLLLSGGSVLVSWDFTPHRSVISQRFSRTALQISRVFSLTLSPNLSSLIFCTVNSSQFSLILISAPQSHWRPLSTLSILLPAPWPGSGCRQQAGTAVELTLCVFHSPMLPAIHRLETVSYILFNFLPFFHYRSKILVSVKSPWEEVQVNFILHKVERYSKSIY